MENIEEILFKAPIPRQGILLIGDFRDNTRYYLKGFQPNINNLIKDRFNPSLILVTELKQNKITAISNIVFRVANSKFNYITNCPIAFATTIECNLQQVFSSMLFTLTHHIFIRHHNLPEHILDYDDIDNILLVLRSVISSTNSESGA